MTLPAGLVPAAAFALTVGISVSVAFGAHLFSRLGCDSFGTEGRSFRSALRTALYGTGLLYLVGVGVVWTIAGGLPFWEVAAALLVAGVVAFALLTALPLAVASRFVERVARVDSETALRDATSGLPVAMLAVFGIFVAPGGLADGTLLAVGGARGCLAGYCGIAHSFAVAVVFELVVAVFGPGVVGIALSVSAGRTGGRRAKP